MLRLRVRLRARFRVRLRVKLRVSGSDLVRVLGSVHAASAQSESTMTV